MMKFLSAVAAVWLATPAGAETQSFSGFSGGLNTRVSSVLLQDNESPDLQNVVLDENGAITRRKGFTKINATAIGGGSSDVNAVYQLEQSNGNKYCVAFSSTNGYYSSDGCQTFTTVVTTLTRNNDVNCDAYGDRLYCANNQYDFYFDGADDIAYAGPSDLAYIRVFRNRCFGAGKDTNPSRLYWSNLGNCGTWTTATDYVDIDAEDGDVITGIGPDLFNFLTIYKKFSTYLLQFDNANTANRKIINVSKSTGAKNHRSIINYNNRQYFSSVGPFGGQPGIYSTDGILIHEDTGKLRGGIDLLSNYYSNIGRKLLDTKADWNAGTFDPMAMSASRDAGFMQSSYSVKTDTLNSDFAQGGSSTVPNTGFYQNGTLSGGIALANSGFECGSLTGCLGWRENRYGGEVAGVDNLAARNIPPTTSWDIGNRSLTLCAVPATGVVIYVQDGISGSTVASANPIMAVGACGSGYINVSGSPSSQSLRLNVDGKVYSSTFSRVESIPYSFCLLASGCLGIPEYPAEYHALIDFPEPFYAKSSTYTSGCYDTRISTPVWGDAAISFSSSAAKTATFRTSVATSCTGVFDSWVAYTPGDRVASEAKPAVRYSVTFSNTLSTTSAEVYNISIPAASSGTWTSGELFLSNTMTGFGTFQTEQTLTGSGSIGYSMKISTYAGGTASTGTITVTPGSSIAHSSGAYVVVSGTFSVFSASETAKLDSLVINWNEGASAKSATMAVYKNRLHFCGQTGAGTTNDVCYVRDLNGAWVKWAGVNARVLNVVSGSLVSGGSPETSSGYLYRLYDSDSDNGAAISAYYDTKDHALGKIQNRKAIDRFYVIGSNDATTLTSAIKADTGLRTLAYDIDFSTGMTFKISHKVIPSSINGNVFRMRFSNNAASKPWSVLGYGLQYRDLGLVAP